MTITGVEAAPHALGPHNGRRRGFRRHVLLFGAMVTVGFELLTLAVRFGTGVSAVEFNRDAPLLLQIHHMFWSVPLFLIAPLTARWSARGSASCSPDLLHHFLVLPLLVGDTGWHWP